MPTFTPFLRLVAQDLYERFRGDFSQVVIVFPNKRASLFLNEYLLDAANNAPIWAPRYQTISELFVSLSDWQLCDPIEAACRIYRLYVTSQRTQDFAQNAASNMAFSLPTLDEFLGWAERILADFEDVDKNMAPAQALFRNLQDLREFDNNDFLSEEEVRALRHFFVDFDPEQRQDLRERYRLLWEQLYDLYTALNEELKSEGKAYEAALYRQVVSDLKTGTIDFPSSVSHYVFVGFNVLDKVEQSLFLHLKKAQKALFYWDYDHYYAGTEEEKKHFEAGLFLRENLLQFPNALHHARTAEGKDAYDNLRHISSIEMVSASSEIAQAQSIAPWLEEVLQLKTDSPTTDTHRLKKTTVVLCNENLLYPTLNALPQGVEHVNVTKGFPLAHTEVATLVEEFFAQSEKSHSPSASVAECLEQLRQVVETEALRYESERETLAQQEKAQNEHNWVEPFERILQSEAYLSMVGVVVRLQQLALLSPKKEKTSLLDGIQIGTLRRIVRQIVRQQSIPFQGEPIVGLQIMGLLETRCLDFENIVMLSVNEGVLPQNSTDNSFIPLILRRAYGLTTPERKTAVYAYYFYRLCQRCQRLRLCYNASTEGLVKGEKSRFMTQLMVESGLTIRHKVLTSQGQTIPTQRQAVAKPPLKDLLAALTHNHPSDNEEADLPYLSPSAINAYLRCQKEFYYKYYLHVRDYQEETEEIAANVFGTIFHYTAELAYRHLCQNGATISPTAIAQLRRDKPLINDFIEQAFAHEGVEQQAFETRAIAIFLDALLKYDQQQGNIHFLGAEKRVYTRLNVQHETEGEFTLIVGGSIDHLDVTEVEHERRLRLIDYKTGGDPSKACTQKLSDIFTRRGKTAQPYLFQTFLYALILLREQSKYPFAAQLPIAPLLFFVNRSGRKDYRPFLQIQEYKHENNPQGEILDFSEIAAEFQDHTTTLLREIFDTSPGAVFQACENPDCPYCKL